MTDLTPSTDSQLVRVFTGQIGGVTASVCDARELHTYLQNQRQFSDWIKQRIEQYGFEENRDFQSFSQKSEKPRGGRPSTEYHLSLDMAKELSMVENNDQGRAARRYFIDMERKALEAASEPKPSLITRRWLISYDHNGKEIITEVPLDAHVMTHKALLQAMLRPDALMVSTEEMFEFAMAALTNLKARSDYMAVQLKKARDAGFKI